MPVNPTGFEPAGFMVDDVTYESDDYMQLIEQVSTLSEKFYAIDMLSLIHISGLAKVLAFRMYIPLDFSHPLGSSRVPDLFGSLCILLSSRRKEMCIRDRG